MKNNPIKKGMSKMKEAGKKATDKLPEGAKAKADKKLGLFMHKYVATLYYFDDEVQEIYWEMEEAVENDNMSKASRLSEEMKTVITLKSNEDSGHYSRRHDKMTKKIGEKLKDQADQMQDISEKSPRKLVDLASQVLGEDEISEEEIRDEFEIEEIEAEN